MTEQRSPIRFSRAIVRDPGPAFHLGLTTAALGAPSLPRAIEQHSRYCEALERCGLAVTRLPALPGFPDATFVEDTAVVRATGAILARPGALSRRGEVASIREALGQRYSDLGAIGDGGTLDGGDVCDTGDLVLIGISGRTNEDGARQLADWLASRGVPSSILDVREIPGLLHLKSGLGDLGGGRLAAVDTLARHQALSSFEIVRVRDEESYAANCVEVNGTVLVASGHPAFEGDLARLGLRTQALDVSEFRKMDGGLSCLSLRF